jgi:hypothetical protein
MLAGVSSPASARSAPAFAPGLAAAATPYNQANFAAVGTGSELHVRGLTSGNTSLLALEQAFAGQSVNSTGLVNNRTPGKSALFDSETGALIQPSTVTTVSKSAYGRGSGVEVGLGIDNTAPTNQNQLVFPTGTGGAKMVESSSPPTPSSGSNSLADLSNTPLSPLVKAKALEATAATNFNNNFCPLGNPIAYGEGQLANADLLNTGEVPVVDTSNKGTTGVAQSKTFSYLSPNTDGTFGITSQTHQTILPLTVNVGPLKISLTVQGAAGPAPIDLKAVAPGEAGQKGGVTLTGNHTVVLNITNNGSPVLPVFPFTFDVQSVVNKPIDIPNVGHVDVSNLKSLAGSNGTTTAGATFDLVHVSLLKGAVAELALGHMEVLANAATPINCTIPTTKTADPQVVQAGNQFTWNILIPSSADAMKDSACNLANLSATDHFGIVNGTPKFTFVSASNGGVFDSKTNTVTWANLGTYKIGDPPIHLTITMSVPVDSDAGLIENTVTPKANLVCPTPPAGSTASLLPASVLTSLNSVPVSGMAHVSGPSISAIKQLPRTGGGPILPWVGGGLLVLAEATRRLIRRARRAPATS